MKFLAYIFLFLFVKGSFAQKEEHEIVFFRNITNDLQISKLYDSIQLPLLIYKNKIFILNSECVKRKSGGDANDRNSGAGVNDRDSDGSNNDRNSGGTSNNRDTASNSNERNSGASSNDRNLGGNSDNRNSGSNSNVRENEGKSNKRDEGGGANQRNSGGVNIYFKCSSDKNGQIILLLYNVKPDNSIKVYNNNKFLTKESIILKFKKT